MTQDSKAALVGRPRTRPLRLFPQLALTHSQSTRFFLFFMAVPAVLYVIAVGVWPLLQGIWFSFWDYNLIRPNRTSFAGLDNYLKVFTDRTARQAVLNTFQFTLFSVGFQLVFGFVLALLLWRDSLFNKIMLALVLIPATMTPILVGLIYKALLSADFGFIGYYLREWGIGPAGGLMSDGSVALWVLIAIDCWHWTPLMALILLAGLKSLPLDVMEASRADGATALQRFRMVILPLMLPAIFLALILRTMDAFRVFDTPFVTTGGGPANATNTMMLLAVKEGLQFFNVGYASALANVATLYMAIMATILIFIVRRADIRINGK
jgi:multiple sugar transport system permease protein